MYKERPQAGAVVHLHSTYSVAVSALADIDATNVLPPITAYYVMRVGRLPLVSYYPPGDLGLADAVGQLAPGKHHAVLLANHGPVVAGSTLDETRMGSGKGSPEKWVAVVKPGRYCLSLLASARKSLVKRCVLPLQASH